MTWTGTGHFTCNVLANKPIRLQTEDCSHDMIDQLLNTQIYMDTLGAAWTWKRQHIIITPSHTHHP